MMDATVQTVDIIIMEECNMRLCTIIFPETSSPKIKEYTFKIPKMLYVKEGDILRNTNYQNSPMKVIRVFDYPVGACNFYNGYLLKELLPEDTQIDRPSKINNQTSNNMETRNISITLEQAMEWYNSGNTTLRTLALNAYTKDELELNYDLIASRVDQACGCFNTPMCEYKKFQVLAKLAIIAKYYNKNWEKTTYNTGYFIGNYNSGNGPVVEILNGVGVYQHTTVQYAGVVYFKNQEDAIKAVKILGDEVKELFK